MYTGIKRYILLVVAILSIIAFMSTQTIAADIVVEGTAASVTQRISTKGNPYTIITLPVQRELNGIKYTTELSVFCFKPAIVKDVKTGDKLKMIAKHTVNKNGDEFTTLISLIK